MVERMAYERPCPLRPECVQDEKTSEKVVSAHKQKRLKRTQKLMHEDVLGPVPAIVEYVVHVLNSPNYKHNLRTTESRCGSGVDEYHIVVYELRENWCTKTKSETAREKGKQNKKVENLKLTEIARASHTALRSNTRNLFK